MKKQTLRRLLFLFSSGILLPNPLTLDDAVKIALQNNKQIRVYQARVDSARGTLEMAKAAQKLRVSLSATATRIDKKTTVTMPSFIPGRPPIQFTIGELYNYRASLSFLHPLDISGKLSLQEDISKLSLNQANLEYEKIREDVIASVKKAFFQALQARKSVSIFESALKAAEAHLQVAKAHYEAGTIPYFEVLRAEVNVANLKQSLLSAQNGYDLARSALLSTMGVDPLTSVELQEEVPSSEASSASALTQYQLPNLDLCVEKALKNRKEITLLRLGIKILEENLNLTKKDNAPDLGIVFAYNWQKPTTTFSPRETNWNAVLSLSFTPFDSGLTRGKIDSLKAKLEELKTNLSQLEDGIKLEVKNAYLTLQNAKEKLQSASMVLEQAREAYRLAQARYEAGVSTQVELLDTQSALTQAEVNYVNSLFEFNIAKIDLEKAMGEIKEER